MTVQQIFSLFFTDDSDYYVSMESFKRSMVKLAMKFGGQIDFNELTKIAQHFDINNDGRVSKVEFKLYCLNIPSIAWKACGPEVFRSTKPIFTSSGQRVK
mmetsp:Transcript_24957/g.57656  ORF Transcript_24957/g.57656 Transcript_24957/m.57656 type:complete len:100 (+) Transcript_24957:4298-4597(+)